MKPTSYRLDIQILRAAAVILVVLSHLPGDISLKGGYLGVDMFFVISGYLVIRSWGRGLNTRNPFELLFAFLKKRVARLSPALLFSVLFTLVLMSLFSSTDTNSWQFLISGLFGGNFLGNFYFWLNGNDYWAPLVRNSPFLHLWSLGVELQTYVAIAFLLLVIALTIKSVLWKRLHFSVFTIIGILSFTYFVILNFRENAGSVLTGVNMSSFYNPLTRAWEFLAGAVMALPLLGQRKHSKVLDLAAGILFALALVLTSVQSHLAPVANVMIVAGCVILLGRSGGESSSVSYWQSGAVWLGDRSYSIYLMHWPIFVFLFGNDPNIPVWKLLFGLVATAVLAEVSYQFFEREFKWLRPSLPLKSFGARFALIHLTVALVVIATLLVEISPVVRSPKTISEASVSLGQPQPMAEKYLDAISSCTKDKMSIVCPSLKAGAENVVAIGDSLALQLFPAIADIARRKGMGARLLWQGGCGIEFGSCDPKVYETIRQLRPKYLFTAMNISRASNLRHGGEAGANVRIKCQLGKPLSTCPAHNAEVQKFLSLANKGIEQLKSSAQTIVIASPFPQQSEHSESCLNMPLIQALFLRGATPAGCGETSIDWQVRRQGRFLSAFASLEDTSRRIIVWDPYEALCSNGECPAVTKTGERVMNDPIHWTWSASRFFVASLERAMAR